MAKGFKDSNGNFRPTGQPVGSSKKQKTIDAGRGMLITQGTFEFIPRERPVSWEVASERFIEFRKDLPDDAGFSFDPVTNTGYDFNDRAQALDFHTQFVEGGENQTVFVIGVQNQLGRNPTRASQSAYEQVRNDGFDPLIGGSWSIVAQQPFTDISIAVSGIDSEEAFDIANDLGQDFISIVNKDGDFFIADVP